MQIINDGALSAYHIEIVIGLATMGDFGIDGKLDDEIGAKLRCFGKQRPLGTGRPPEPHAILLPRAITDGVELILRIAVEQYDTAMVRKPFALAEKAELSPQQQEIKRAP